MKPVHYLFILSMVVLCSTAFLCYGQPVASQAVSVADLKSVPDGNYLVTLEGGGQVQRLNLLIQNNRAKCVNSTDPKLKDIQGQFQLKGNGVFVAMLQAPDFRATQLWIFRADGAAAVREVPDRGEQQNAVPVKGASLEVPKKK
jgi:hypothetical protein